MTEMQKLSLMLKGAGIPHEMIIQPMYHTPQLCFPDRSRKDSGVICHDFSYGGNVGLLETMGFGEDDVIGFLNAEEALKIITRYYININR